MKIKELKAFKRGRRLEEIEDYGHAICYNKIFRNKKKYYRKFKHKKDIIPLE